MWKVSSLLSTGRSWMYTKRPVRASPFDFAYSSVLAGTSIRFVAAVRPRIFSTFLPMLLSITWLTSPFWLHSALGFMVKTET